MLDDIFSVADANPFLLNSPMNVYTFQLTANHEIVPVSPLSQQTTSLGEAFHAEVLVANDCSLIAIYEALESIEPLYNYAPFEWNTTVCLGIQEDMIVICVMRIAESKEA